MKDFKGCTVTEWEIKNKFSVELTLEEIANNALKGNFTITELQSGNFMIGMLHGNVELTAGNLLKILLLIEDKK